VLASLLNDVQLDDTPDQRTSFFQDEAGRLMSGVIYWVSTKMEQPCPSYKFVWRNFAPPRVKIFAWLLTKNRINCRTALVTKNILQEATCEICGQADETADHIFSECNFVRSFWSRIGWNPGYIAPVSELWLTQTPPRVHADTAHPTILLCCWEIWKHRNEVVFRGMQPKIDRLVSACKEQHALGPAGSRDGILPLLTI